MEKVDEVLGKVLERIKPTKKEMEENRAVARRIMDGLRKTLPPRIELELVGSVEKGTSLKDDVDIDIFILFPKDYSRKDLLTLGMEYAMRAVKPGVKWEVGYAEHPYLKAKIENCDVEIVPSFRIYDISERLSSADRSPLHSRYVKKHLTERMADDVRLLKKFMKRLGIYGAEVKVEGFSGYLCELLIIRYGSFLSLIKEAASKWERPIMDMEGERNPDELRKLFPDAAMIFIDPVDPRRNVAASVSERSLSKFILASRAFLANPCEEFFFEPKLKVKADEIGKMKRRIYSPETHFVVMRFPAPVVVPDILWPQLRKTAQIFVKLFEEHGFKVLDYGYWTDEEKSCLLIFQFEVFALPPLRKIMGPEIRHRKGVEDFVRVHKNAPCGPWVENGRVCVMEKRKYRKAPELAKEIATKPRKYAIPSHISKVITKYKRLKSPSLFRKKYLKFLHEYVFKKEFFLR